MSDGIETTRLHIQVRVVHSFFGARDWSDTVSLGEPVMSLHEHTNMFDGS